jgi:uncharacterized protein YsxB (DUF464 family)
MWLMFVTMTTVGYGDHVPSSHGGRVVCATASILGIVLASLITAALGNLMTFSSNEQSALLIVTREKSRIRMRQFAATILVLWWRRLKDNLTLRQVHNHCHCRDFSL